MVNDWNLWNGFNCVIEQRNRMQPINNKAINLIGVVLDAYMHNISHINKIIPQTYLNTQGQFINNAKRLRIQRANACYTVGDIRKFSDKIVNCRNRYELCEMADRFCLPEDWRFQQVYGCHFFWIITQLNRTYVHFLTLFAEFCESALIENFSHRKAT